MTELTLLYSCIGGNKPPCTFHIYFKILMKIEDIMEDINAWLLIKGSPATNQQQQ